jgi:putative ABC transport system ATP-binding protein
VSASASESAAAPAPPATTIVSASGLTRVFGEGEAEVRALDGVDVAFAKGQFTAIMGPSGSGKSTLMHILAGLDRPTSGTVIVDGIDLSTLDDAEMTELRRDKVGFVFQFFNLVANMTVADNVELPALLAGASTREASQRRKYLLGELGLTDRADAAPSQLSGGEQQRVALARALANQPSLLLADEPTGNLDSRNTRDVLRLLGEVHRDGQTVILVTHDARVAGLADRVVSLFDGEIVDDGTIGVTRRRPKATAGDVVELRG